jgi:diadenylate cyclase
MTELLNSLNYATINFWEYVRNIIDIILVASIFYLVYRFLAKTRAIQLLKGVMIILLVAVISKFLKLTTLDWLITNIASSVVIAMIVLFQPELRRLITQFGQRNWISPDLGNEAFPLDELVNAVMSMAEENIGSLIVIERSTGLRSYSESGVVVDASISEEFIRTVFFPLTPLHDGAIIIQEGRIKAAACYLPLSDSKQLTKQYGARHRAALGIAEETDALVLITSEETGSISIMVNARFYPKVKVTDLKNMILFFMNPKTAYEEKFRTLK